MAHVLPLIPIALLALAAPLSAATFIVNATADAPAPPAGMLTLRAAIEKANQTPEPDEIHFALPAADPNHRYYKDDGVVGEVALFKATATTADNDSALADADPDHRHSWWTIDIKTPLPPITAPLTIDGFTQAGAQPAKASPPPIDAVLRVEIDGSTVSDTAAATARYRDGNPYAPGIRVRADKCVIRGLVLTRFSTDSSAALIIDASDAVVEGNFIGVDPSGLRAKPNFFGVQISNTDARKEGVAGTRVGAAGEKINDPATRNLISGNYGGGVLVTGDAKNNVISGNIIGADRAGTGKLGNGHGVLISQLAGGNKVSINIIAFNTKDGVNVGSRYDQDGFDNAILGNSIHDNSGLGINLAKLPEGTNIPTENDKGDVDEGPNHLQNFPELSAARTTGLFTMPGSSSRVHVTGTLKTNRDTSYRLEFFANSAGDASGYGEGRTFLGATTVNMGPTPIVDFDATLDVPVPVGHAIAATATELDASGAFKSTSEFSKWVPLKPRVPPSAWAAVAGAVVVGLVGMVIRSRRRKRPRAVSKKVETPAPAV